MEQPNPDRLPSAKDALTQAYQRMLLGDMDDAEVWIALAREIREGSTPPLITKWLEASRPGDRLTLHDVEGIVCAHGRVAVRRKTDDRGRWFLHTDDGSNCEDDDAPREHERRHPQHVEKVVDNAGHEATFVSLDEVKRFDRTGKLDPLPADAPKTRPVERVHVAPYQPAHVRPVAALPDKIFGYIRGQMALPDEQQIRFAQVWRRSLDAGSPLPQPFVEADRPAASSLIDEILDRGRQYAADVPAWAEPGKMPRDFMQAEDDPGKTAQFDGSKMAPSRHASAGSCKHCHFEIYEVKSSGPGSSVGHRHTLTGQAVCHVRRAPGAAVTFATPTKAEVASAE